MTKETANSQEFLLKYPYLWTGKLTRQEKCPVQFWTFNFPVYRNSGSTGSFITAYIFINYDVKAEGKMIYLPVYMSMFIQDDTPLPVLEPII